MRTYSDEVKDGDFARCVDALQLQGKNLVNTTLYVIRNVLSALDEDGQIKSTAVPAQRTILAEANLQVERINVARLAKYEAKLTDQVAQEAQESTPVKPPKVLRLFGTDDPEQRARPFAILNATLLDNVVRAHRDAEAFSVYSAVPAVLAQYMISRVLESFTGFFEALKSYRISPAAFTGRPAMPGYLDRHARATIGFTAQSLQKKHGIALAALGAKTVHTDYGKTEALPDDVKRAFDLFDLESVLTKLCKRNKVPAEAILCEVRLVPIPGKRIRIEGVYKVPMALPAGTLAYRLLTAVATEQPEIKASKVNEALLARLRAIPADQVPRTAGADLGVNNFISLAYATGQRGMVLSNDRIEQKIAAFDARIDRRKSELTSPELRALQARHKARQLTKAELKGFKKGLAAIYTDGPLMALQQDRARWVADALHKVSCGIVAQLKQRKIELLVIGLNSGWKQNIDLGREQNRRALSAAHTRLIGLLQYKCLQAGILVVTCEESYTSKTSFALDEPLQFYVKAQSAKQAAETLMASTKEDPPPAPATTSATILQNSHVRQVLAGRRGTGAKRHFFNSTGLAATISKAWTVVHADTNSCLNIVKKVFSHFCLSDNLHAGFWLHWLSPRKGLAGMRLTSQ